MKADKRSAACPHSLPAADNRSKMPDRTAMIRATAVKIASDTGGAGVIAAVAATVPTAPISAADINKAPASAAGARRSGGDEPRQPD